MSDPIIRGCETSRRHRRWHVECPSCGHVHVVDQRIGDGNDRLTFRCTRAEGGSWVIYPWRRADG